MRCVRIAKRMFKTKVITGEEVVRKGDNIFAISDEDKKK